jgi:hypothetical protein
VSGTWKSIPETISDEAKRFYQTAKPLERWALGGGGVEALRVEEHEETEPINEAIVRNYVGSLEEGEIAGVPVQTVTPKDYDARNDGRGSSISSAAPMSWGAPSWTSPSPRVSRTDSA